MNNIEIDTIQVCKHKINEEFLYVLINKENKIGTDEIKIEKEFIPELEELKILCEFEGDNIIEICNYLKATISLKALEKQFYYCVSLDGSYQNFIANINTKIQSLIKSRETKYDLKSKNPEYNLEKSIAELKIKTLNEVDNWIKAYNINQTYKACLKDKSILAYSHRVLGWSNFKHQLTPNFNIELITNFGYGSSSYFYVKMKYKNVEVTPFSDWINYEIAKFSEIMRYSKSFAGQKFIRTSFGKKFFIKVIKNENWQQAIEFAKDACNCSLRSEEEFIKSYIIEECENMITGLENIFLNEEFSFIGEDNNYYKVDKRGHFLMEFRGEKISGSLDFISKILEFSSITEISSFISRIEECNKKIQPSLVKELKIIFQKLALLNIEFDELTPKHLAFTQKNQEYLKLKNSLLRELVNSKQINIKQMDNSILNIEFNERYPEYKEFENEYNIVNSKYNFLKDNIHNLEIIAESIEGYNLKILDYFSNK